MNTKHGKNPFEVLCDQNGFFCQSIFNKSILGNKISAKIGKYSAVLLKQSYREGTDHLGEYKEWTLNYKSPKDPRKQFVGLIQSYVTHTVFSIRYLFDVKAKNNNDLHGKPYISFPHFSGEDWEKDCACLSFKSKAPFNYPEQWFGKVTDIVKEERYCPLLVTNRDYESLILSPLNYFLHGTVSIHGLSQTVRCGLPREVENVNTGTEYKTIMVYRDGVVDTLWMWGKLLRHYNQLSHTSMYQDTHLKSLSYWTNAGSAYWYKVHKKTSYEETLKNLVDHHKSIKLNYGSYQLDSWWYKKEGNQYTSGILEWEPKQKTLSKNFNAMLPFFQRYKQYELFEVDRISHIQNILKRPIGCHFKQLSKDSVYVQGKENAFYLEPFPIPKTKEGGKDLFSKIFYHPNWKLSYVIHDWLQFMNDRHEKFKDLSVAKEYYQALDESCLDIEAPMNACGHLTLQLCMTQPNATMMGGMMEAVTAIRSTSDSNSFFIEGPKRWWWHLYSSVFIQGLGKYAYFDNRRTRPKTFAFWPFVSNAKLEMIWLGLSCGPIGIGDPIGKENIDLLRRVADSDGIIIKPDHPCMPLDQCFLYNPYSYESDKGISVYSDSYIEGIKEKIYYVLTMNMHPYRKKVKMSYAISELNKENSEKQYIVYNYFSKKYKRCSAQQREVYLLRGKRFYYHIISPMVEGVAILGDINKHVTASRQRIKSVDDKENILTIQLRASQAKDKVCFVLYMEQEPIDIRLNANQCNFHYKNQLLSIDIPLIEGEITISIKKFE